MSMGNQLVVGVELVASSDKKEQVDDNPLDVESNTSFQTTIMPRIRFPPQWVKHK